MYRNEKGVVMFEFEINRLQDCIDKLKQEGRYDDAKMEQIKVNVYKHTMEVKLYTDKASIDLKDQLIDIRHSWEEALKIAESFDDEDKAMAERVKIETINHILERI